MQIFYILLSFAATLLITIYLSILIIGLIMDFITKHKFSKQDLIKKYDSGYKEMFKYLNNAMSGKNKETYSTEEENLEQLKMLINKRIDELKGN